MLNASPINTHVEKEKCPRRMVYLETALPDVRTLCITRVAHVRLLYRQCKATVASFLCPASPVCLLVAAFHRQKLAAYLHHLDPLLQVLRYFRSSLPALCAGRC
jgi:hypothetical protein